MKNLLLYIIPILYLFTGCSENALDKIDTNPNNPKDVTIKLLIPNVTSAVPYYLNSTELAWYCSVFSEQTTGTYSQMRSADNRTNLNSTLTENIWKNVYADVLMNLKIIIDKGTTGDEAGNFKYVGIAQILYAYTMQSITDLFGHAPFSDALNGKNQRQPKYDTQQEIYNNLQLMLNDAIGNLDKASTQNPGSEDLIYGGNTESWKKAAYALKARMLNRTYLKSSTPVTSMDTILKFIDNSFQNASESMIFKKWSGVTDKDHQNPWYLESKQKRMLSVSKTVFDLFDKVNDPRKQYLFTKPDGINFVPAPNGNSKEDPNGIIYSKISSLVLYPDAPLPMITWEELMFIKAEVYFAKDLKNMANFAYEQALESTIKKFVPDNIANQFLGDTANPIRPGQDGITLRLIFEQKYLSLWPYQSLEAYSEYRRKGTPVLSNTQGAAPARLPYPQSEVTANGVNVPNVTIYDKVWWADGTDD